MTGQAMKEAFRCTRTVCDERHTGLVYEGSCHVERCSNFVFGARMHGFEERAQLRQVVTIALGEVVRVIPHYKVIVTVFAGRFFTFKAICAVFPGSRRPCIELNGISIC